MTIRGTKAHRRVRCRHAIVDLPFDPVAMEAPASPSGEAFPHAFDLDGYPADFGRCPSARDANASEPAMQTPSEPILKATLRANPSTEYAKRA